MAFQKSFLEYEDLQVCEHLIAPWLDKSNGKAPLTTSSLVNECNGPNKERR